MTEPAFRIKVRTRSGWSVMSVRMDEAQVQSVLEHFDSDEPFKRITARVGTAHIRASEIEAVVVIELDQTGRKPELNQVGRKRGQSEEIG